MRSRAPNRTPAAGVAGGCAVLSATVLACSTPAVGPWRCAFPAAPWAPELAGADYQVHVSAGPRADELCVEARARPEHLGHLVVAPRARPFVRDPAVLRADAWETITPDAGLATRCETGSSGACVVRYRFALREAARSLATRSDAQEYGDVVMAPASTWIVRPDRAPPGARYRVRVDTPAGVAFANGLFRARGAPRNVYEGEIAALGEAPYAAFGPLRLHPIRVPGAEIEVALTPGSTGVEADRVTRWIDASARAVATYYGSFPIERALVLVRAGGRGGVGQGSTLGDGGGSILVHVGEDTDESELARDWILVHEMVHLSFPSVLRPWAEEGLATYVEPIIRARAGLAHKDEVWRDMILGLPKGLPERGDRGLEHTDTWGRRYWGGALFWFLADLEIRERSQNQRSLDDALRGVVAAGGNVAVTWDLTKTLELGDRTVQLPVLVELYRQLGFAPVRVDLDALWHRLGVRLVDRRVLYDDAAPLAAVRASITGG